MTITVRTAKDIRQAHRGRYFLIRDVSGAMRVVSTASLKELSPYVASNGDRHYKFATQPGGYQNSWSQREIALQFSNTRDTVQANAVQVSKLANAGVIRVAQEAVADAAPATTDQFGGGYVIASVVKGSGALSFASKPKIHATSESAEAEAERLASTAPGKEFVVFKATMSAVKASVVTRKF